VWLPDGEKDFRDMLTDFDRIDECDGQMDRQMDTMQRHRPRLCMASRGKYCINKKQLRAAVGIILFVLKNIVSVYDTIVCI